MLGASGPLVVLIDWPLGAKRAAECPGRQRASRGTALKVPRPAFLAARALESPTDSRRKSTKRWAWRHAGHGLPDGQDVPHERSWFWLTGHSMPSLLDSPSSPLAPG